MAKIRAERPAETAPAGAPATLGATVRHHLGQTLRTHLADTLAAPVSERLDALVARLQAPKR